MPIYGKEIPMPEHCEECGEKEYPLNPMPEGQWMCNECCAMYWVDEYEDYEMEDE